MTDAIADPEAVLTPLAGLHNALGGRMVPFAGYSLPVQYPTGVMAEHAHTRAAAGLFDISHMGQIRVVGPDADRALETLMPADLVGLPDGRQAYTLLTNADGGIDDDLMIARDGDAFFLVVNAACKAGDFARIADAMQAHGVTATMAEDRAMLALQGPEAGAVLAALAPDSAAMRFMDARPLDIAGIPAWVSRSGYTGEDGFEISVAETDAEALARALLDDPRVRPIGLGARDSLRLEAGLCLYGQDMDATTTPRTAALGWAIAKVRRTGGARAGGFPGADRILGEAPADTRVGLLPEGRAPMRAGVTLFATEDGTDPIGRITSGGFGPTLGAPVSMARIATGHAQPGTRVWGAVRGRRQPATITPLPFVPHRYHR